MSSDNNALRQLCDEVRAKLAQRQQRAHCRAIIADAMGQFPHAPEPHNLMGVLLEKEGDHVLAMKHFRASWALDPTYAPAHYNLALYGAHHAQGPCAFDESDCSQAETANAKTQ